jgi:hypothetical protein
VKYKVIVQVSAAGDKEEHVIESERVDAGGDTVLFSSGGGVNYRVHFVVPKDRLIYVLEQKQGQG